MGFFGGRPRGGIASDRQVVFNDAGRLGGIPEFLFDKLTKTLTVENCQVIGAFTAKGGLKASINPPPVDGGPQAGEMALWFDPEDQLLYVLARDAAGAAALFQLARTDDARFEDSRAPLPHTHAGTDISSAVENANAVPWTGVTGKPSSFPPVGHTHSGAEVTSAVASAQNASAVPWAGVTGKPATFPPSGHTHDGGEITTPVANANAAASVPWTGVTGVPAQYPPAAHGHSGADISPGTLSGDRLADSSVPHTKARTDAEIIPNSNPGWQELAGGAAFQPGCYLFRVDSADGHAGLFIISVGHGNGTYSWASGVNANCVLSQIMGPSSMVLQITGLGDGREYGILVDFATGVTSFRTLSGSTAGNTTLSYRRLF